MYLFFHLITGVILGLLLGDLLHDGRWLIPAAIGAILPDLIDKPVGQILLLGEIGYGRIIFHTLLVFAIVLILGLVLWRYRRSLVVLALATGIFSHQILDSMWNEPADWLYPFFGQPPLWRTFPPGYLMLLVRDNLENPPEWFLGALFFIGLYLYLKRDRVIPAALGHRKGLQLILEGSGIFLWMISGLVFTYGLLRKILSHSGRFGLSNFLIYSLVFALAAYLFWRWGSALGEEQPAKEA
ncbi:MAG: metal-dependent hydrolase [Methanomicrobiales archaeon]|nr:metal-dependent hydrolase [Methanomicrobiales archaeon]